MDYTNYYSFDHYVDFIRGIYPNLSDYELASLAIQLQRNDILKAGLNVVKDNSHSTSLEAIAIQLGHKKEGFTTDVVSAIEEVSASINNKG